MRLKTISYSNRSFTKVLKKYYISLKGRAEKPGAYITFRPPPLSPSLRSWMFFLLSGHARFFSSQIFLPKFFPLVHFSTVFSLVFLFLYFSFTFCPFCRIHHPSVLNGSLADFLFECNSNYLTLNLHFTCRSFLTFFCDCVCLYGQNPHTSTPFLHKIIFFYKLCFDNSASKFVCACLNSVAI